MLFLNDLAKPQRLSPANHTSLGITDAMRTPPYCYSILFIGTAASGLLRSHGAMEAFVRLRDSGCWEGDGEGHTAIVEVEIPILQLKAAPTGDR